MIYFAISNLGLAIMMIVIYVRYSKLLISSGRKIKGLEEIIATESAEKISLQEQLLTETKEGKEKVDAALKDVEKVRKEKESEMRKEKEYEMKLRLEAEKQIELALQKTDEVQKRMQDWRVIQDAVMKDSKEEISKLADSIYEKMSEDFKAEGASNKNLLMGISQNILELTSTEDTPKNAAKQAKPLQKKSIVSSSHIDSVTKSLMAELIEMMQANGHLANKDFFLSENFDSQNTKLFLCEMAFVTKSKLHIIDFKINRYLEEYKKDQDLDSLQLRLKKYLTYLSNTKYAASVQQALSSSNVEFTKSDIVIALPSESEIALIQKAGCYDKALKLGLVIADFDDLNDIIL